MAAYLAGMGRWVSVTALAIAVTLATAIAGLAVHQDTKAAVGAAAGSTLPGYVPAPCPGAIVAVFFEPATATDAVVALVRDHVAQAAPGRRIVYVDQHTGYREFQGMFAGTDESSSLSEFEIPPSLRVATDAAGAARVMTRVRNDPGVKDVAQLLQRNPDTGEAVSVDLSTLLRLRPHAGGCMRPSR